MSNLVDHAERELSLISMGKDCKDGMNRSMHDHIIRMVQAFEDEGHSGLSASYAVSILRKLLAYEPISPLTGEDKEWNEVAEGMFQNKRCSRIFKQDGRIYDIEGRVFREKDGSCFTNKESRVDITFPYTPKTEYVDVP